MNVTLSQAISHVQNTGTLFDIHLSEILDKSSNTSAKNLLEASVKFLASLNKDELYTLDDLEVYVSIDLVSDYDYLKGAPDSYQELIEQIDFPYSDPEFLCYRLKQEKSLERVNEFYRKPLLFPELKQYYNELEFLYSEFRSSIEEDFIRDLKIRLVR